MKNRNNDKLKSTEKRTILVVEDDPDFLWMIALGLKDEYQVIEAANGKIGMEKALEFVPDLIVTDLMMPVMDGIEFCRLLKTTEETSHIPVIMLTAKTSIESQIEGLETGADDYVTKPFNKLLLKTRVRNLLRSRNVLRKQFSRNFMIPNQPTVEASPDQLFLKQCYDVLEEYYGDTEFTAERLAEELNMSLRTLHRKLKSLTGETPSKLIGSVRLKKAGVLLRSTDIRISDIAYKVGYTESSHFSRNFRQLYGQTPSEYRLDV